MVKPFISQMATFPLPVSRHTISALPSPSISLTPSMVQLNGTVRGTSPVGEFGRTVAADPDLATAATDANPNSPQPATAPLDAPPSDPGTTETDGSDIKAGNSPGDAGTRISVTNSGNPDDDDGDGDDVDDVHTIGSASGDVQEYVEVDFDVSEEELITMRALGRVVGRSPRTVKRFINIDVSQPRHHILAHEGVFYDPLLPS